MKPYFTKYLPVEGEIKEGEPYKNKELKGEVQFATADWKQKILDFYSVTKVKLFLCSRDIQVGDSYTCPHKGKGIDVGFGQPKQVEVWMTYSKERNLCPDCYKVIGEISPKAVWVKEGDEFSEDQIDMVPFLNGEEYGADSQSLQPELDWIWIAKIECPTCGHFH